MKRKRKERLIESLRRKGRVCVCVFVAYINLYEI